MARIQHTAGSRLQSVLLDAIHLLDLEIYGQWDVPWLAAAIGMPSGAPAASPGNLGADSPCRYISRAISGVAEARI